MSCIRCHSYGSNPRLRMTGMTGHPVDGLPCTFSTGAPYKFVGGYLTSSQKYYNSCDKKGYLKPSHPSNTKT